MSQKDNTKYIDMPSFLYTINSGETGKKSSTSCKENLQNNAWRSLEVFKARLGGILSNLT